MGALPGRKAYVAKQGPAEAADRGYSLNGIRRWRRQGRSSWGCFCYRLCSDRPSGAAASLSALPLRLLYALCVLLRAAVPCALLLTALAVPTDGKPARAAWQDFALRATLRGHTNLVRSVAFAPDGKTLVTGGADRALRLWDAHTGKPLGVHVMPKSG